MASLADAKHWRNDENTANGQDFKPVDGSVRNHHAVER
jgi:hypothetical protein